MLIPVNPQLWSATGLTQLLNIIVKVKKRINPSVTVGEANFYSQSLLNYHPKSKVSMAYQDFAKGMIQHGQQ
ncbi:hypothetical protein HpSIM50_15470 [Helicobacter pylori]